jgi:flagellar motility protein MotE (MotC chaperone)
MSTSSRLDLNSNIRSVIEWQSDGATHVLARPDPKVSLITLTIHFNSKSAHFEVRVPFRLKGVDTQSDITLRACASSVISLDLVKNPTLPAEVEQWFDTTALGLRFKLNCNLVILVANTAVEPICPKSGTRSGPIFDAVRDFSHTTEFTIYIEAREAPAKLKSISDAISKGLFEPSNSSHFQLSSMYAGLGAKIVQLPQDKRSMPPSYEEVESPPPPPPVDQKSNRKRPRQDTQTERNSDIDRIWAELEGMKKAKFEDRKRIALLEKENQELRKDMEALEEQYKILDKSHQDLNHSFEALETVTGKNTEENYESFSNDLEEVREDISKLSEELRFVQDGPTSDEFVVKVKDAVLQDITTRLSAD